MVDVLVAIGTLFTAFFTGVLAWLAWRKAVVQPVPGRAEEPTLQVDKWRINGDPELSGRADEVFNGTWDVSFVISEIVGVPTRLNEIRTAIHSRGGVTNPPAQSFKARVISVHAPYEATVAIDAMRDMALSNLWHFDVTLCFSGYDEREENEITFHALIQGMNDRPEDGYATVRIEAKED
ncbi:MAG: hypothetical protein OXN89_15750 [Bryobacterales bacterium]|nr:hypothetical protein [Bryobacterales bacterium]